MELWIHADSIHYLRRLLRDLEDRVLQQAEQPNPDDEELEEMFRTLESHDELSQIMRNCVHVSSLSFRFQDFFFFF